MSKRQRSFSVPQINLGYIITRMALMHCFNKINFIFTAPHMLRRRLQPRVVAILPKANGGHLLPPPGPGL